MILIFFIIRIDEDLELNIDVIDDYTGKYEN